MSLPSAAKNGDIAKVKKLLERGADVNERDEYGKTCDSCHAVALSCFPHTLTQTLGDSFQTELKNTAIISDESALSSWSRTNPDP
jgi:ankyrin repeat protein